MIIINTDFGGNAYNLQRTNINGLSVSFRFLWNERAGAWFCDFESANGANYGIELKPGRLILGRSNNVNKDGGDFAIIKTEKTSNENLGFDNFGTTYKLCYLSAEDIKIFENAGVL